MKRLLLALAAGLFAFAPAAWADQSVPVGTSQPATRMNDVAVVNPATGARVTPAGSTDITQSQAAAGSDASKATAVQGITGGKPISSTGVTALVSGTFTTPSGTTAYASGDLVANSGTAGSVTPLSFAACRVNQGTGMVRRARIKTPDTGFAAGSVRLHLYRDSPTPTNGDNGVWLTTESTYLGSIDVTLDKHFSDSEKGIGAPNTGSEINFDCASASSTIYGLLEARGAITPQGSKLFTVTLEVLQN